MTWPVIFAIVNTLAMIGAGIYVLFRHARQEEDIESRVDFSFNANTLKRVLLYYRTMAALMALFFSLFVLSLIFLQHFDGVEIFAEGKAFYVSMLFFALDLVLRGAIFDLMEHFDLSVTPVSMNREHSALVWYCFVFRMFFAVTLLKILISFAWIWSKVRRALKEASAAGGQEP
jgi:hypothetical protein